MNNELFTKKNTVCNSYFALKMVNLSPGSASKRRKASRKACFAPFCVDARLCSVTSFDQTDGEEQGCRKRGEERQIKTAVGGAEADCKIQTACNPHDVPG